MIPLSVLGLRFTTKSEHWGHLVMGNGPEMDFSAPPDAQGHAGVFTPEDAFVAAANTCIMMMFIWAAERFKLKLVSYQCRAEGAKLIGLDRTEIFTHLRLWPVIQIAAGGEDRSTVEARACRALPWRAGLPRPAHQWFGQFPASGYDLTQPNVQSGRIPCR